MMAGLFLFYCAGHRLDCRLFLCLLLLDDPHGKASDLAFSDLTAWGSWGGSMVSVCSGGYLLDGWAFFSYLSALLCAVLWRPDRSVLWSSPWCYSEVIFLFFLCKVSRARAWQVLVTGSRFWEQKNDSFPHFLLRTKWGISLFSFIIPCRMALTLLAFRAS